QLRFPVAESFPLYCVKLTVKGKRKARTLENTSKRKLCSHMLVVTVVNTVVVEDIKKERYRLYLYFKVVPLSLLFAVYDLVLHVVVVYHVPHFCYVVNKQLVNLCG